MAFPFPIQVSFDPISKGKSILYSPVCQSQGEELEARRLEEEVGVGFAQLTDAGDAVAEPPDHLN